MIKDYLQDLILHTQGLSGVELVKIAGTDLETQISAASEDRTVVVFGTLKTPVTEFAGTFGMPNLPKLKTILGFEDYDDTASIVVLKENTADPDVPTAIHFETKTKDFINDYRLMSKAVVENIVKTIKFNGTTWDIEFEPTIAGIQRLKKQASANSEEINFKMKTDGADLKIYFGDPSTHSGNFVFHSDLKGKIVKSWNWPIKVFLAIMDLPGDKTVRVADAGVTEITVDSGLIVWQFLIPAQAK